MEHERHGNVDLFDLVDLFDIAEGRRPRRVSSGAKKLRGSAPHAPVQGARLADRVAALLRVAMRTPEVVVKVTGSNTSRAGVRAHLTYLGREEGAEAELADGELLVGRTAIADAADLFDSEDAFVMTNRASSGSTAIHVVFSMPAGTVRGPALRDAARETARWIFAGHEYLLVLHSDRDHKHVHAVVSARDVTGRRLRHYKPQVHAWRKEFALQLRSRGVPAEASSRQVRGVTQRSVSRVVRSLRDQQAAVRPGGHQAGVVSDLSKARAMMRALESRSRERSESPRPWEDATRTRRAQMETGWTQLGKYLRNLGTAEGRIAASVVDRFQGNLPALRSEQGQIEERSEASRAEHTRPSSDRYR